MYSKLTDEVIGYLKLGQKVLSHRVPQLLKAAQGRQAGAEKQGIAFCDTFTVTRVRLPWRKMNTIL